METAKQIAREHTDDMRNDPEYLTFVQNYIQNAQNNVVWWEDDAWLDNPNNINFDVDGAASGIYDKLTAAEKELVKLHRRQAFVMFLNKPIAEQYTSTYMGTSGLNDKSDAFRHAMFNAMNARDCGEHVTQLFADAHESEVPQQLQLEKHMDWHNNSIGIQYGKNLSLMSSSGWNINLKDAILSKLNNGEMVYMKNINYNDPNFWGAGNPANATHGIDSTTYLIPTNQ